MYSSIIYSQSTNFKENVLGNPEDINAFHRFSGLTIDSVNLLSKTDLFLLNWSLCFIYFAAL